MQDFFHMAPLRQQNINTSLCALTKNGSFMPLFVIFGPVTNKLQLTVSFDHPVDFETLKWQPGQPPQTSNFKPQTDF